MKRGVFVVALIFCAITVAHATPSIDTVEISSTFGFNTTVENLSVAIINASTNTYNITRWTRNATPFETTLFAFENSTNSSNHTEEPVSQHIAIVEGATFLLNGGIDESDAYSFDGIDDVISLAHNINYDLPLTVSAWVNLTTGGPLIVSENFSGGYRGFYVYVTGTSLVAQFGNGGAPVANSRRTKSATMADIADNQWHHIVSVIRGVNDMDLYVDNVDVGGSYSGSASFMADGQFGPRIGNQGGAAYFNGTIDEVRVIERSLTSAQVNNLYLRNNEIHADETITGELWSTCVIPHDGTAGAEVCSSNTTIRAVDQALGNESQVNQTGITNLDVKIDGSDNLTVDFGTYLVELTDDTGPIVSFTHDFSQSILNLDQITLIKTPDNIIVNLNDQLQPTQNKTISLITAQRSVCVKDVEITSYLNITPTCTGINETLFLISACDGVTRQNGIRCTKNGTLWSFDGLTNSGAQGQFADVPEFSTVALFLAAAMILGTLFYRRRDS